MTGLSLACVGVFIGLFFVVYIDYLQQMAGNDFVEWDVKTITAGDYTIEFDVAPEVFAAWNEKESKDWQKHFSSKVEAYRDWF